MPTSSWTAWDPRSSRRSPRSARASTGAARASARWTRSCASCSGWTRRWRSTATARPSSAASSARSAWTTSTPSGTAPRTSPAPPRSRTRRPGCPGSCDPAAPVMSLHPSVAAVRLGVRRCLADLEPGSTVVVACSGGADSLALLAATVFEARTGSLRVVGATVDHGLQPGSAAHADRVVAQMAALGADETLTARVQVEGGGLGPEAAARRARYAVLEQVAEHTGAVAVLLGHTRDDQAETVLLGLTRGSGGRALAGMRRSFGRYRRPLLDVPRDDTLTACRVEGLEFWDDPHNHDHGF